MNFDFSDEQKQLKQEARRLLERECSSSAVRTILDGPEPFHHGLWARVAEMGFLGAAIPEAYGGLGAGYLELCAIAEEFGRALAPIPFSSSVYLAAEFLLIAGSEEQKRQWLPKIASGAAIGTLALAETGGPLSPESIRVAASNGRLSGVKMPVADGDIADFAVVVARGALNGDGRAISLFLVDLKQPAVTREVVETIDPTRSHARLIFDNAAAEPIGGAGEGWAILTQVLDRAAVLTAFEQLGGADRALEIARDYALERMAFGRTIASFQAVKHMLADMYVSATLARSNCYYGAWALSTGADDLPAAAATARVSATQAYQHCAKNGIQVHGGMGFTWEFDCHLHYRRSNLLALSLGSLSHWESLLIERLSSKHAA